MVGWLVGLFLTGIRQIHAFENGLCSLRSIPRICASPTAGACQRAVPPSWPSLRQEHSKIVSCAHRPRLHQGHSAPSGAFEKFRPPFLRSPTAEACRRSMPSCRRSFPREHSKLRGCVYRPRLCQGHSKSPCLPYRPLFPQCPPRPFPPGPPPRPAPPVHPPEPGLTKAFALLLAVCMWMLLLLL